MIRIIEIRPYRRTKLFEVYTEDGPQFLASEKFLAENGISLGEAFGEEEFELLQAKAQILDGIRKAVDILSRKDYSRKELQKKLCEKGIPEDAADAAVEYVASKGYQSDERYARRLAEVAGNAYGVRRVEQMLYAHGIEKELIREITEDLFFDEAKADDVLDSKLRKAAKNLDLSDPAAKNKLYAKLLRLGFEGSRISAAISRYEEHREEDLL